MLRVLSFLDDKGGVELVMPVTPAGYAWVRGTVYETVHIDQLGEVNIPAGKKPHSANVEFLLPAHAYVFMTPGATADPQRYLDQLNKWQREATVLRYIVSGTDINEPVRIQELKQEETDGTNDVTVTLTLREYLAVEAVPVSNSDTAVTRPAGTALTSACTYVVQAGDTLSGIARRFYGDASLYWRLAAANNIANANLIRVGQVLIIPTPENLPTAVSEEKRPASAQVAEEAKSPKRPVLTAAAELAAQLGAGFMQAGADIGSSLKSMTDPVLQWVRDFDLKNYDASAKISVSQSIVEPFRKLFLHK